MSSTAVVTERERYTVAGIIRHLARQQPDHEMFVLGDERRTWARRVRRCLPRRAGGGREGVEGRGPDRFPGSERHGVFRFSLRRLADRSGQRRRQLADCAGRDGSDHRRFASAGVGRFTRTISPPWPKCRAVCPRCVGSWSSVKPNASNAPIHDRCPSSSGSTGAATDDPGHVGAEDEVSMQLYTSGTTGLPKGVMLTNGNLSTAIAAANRTFNISRGHGQPRGDAALPYRRVGVGAVRHVAGRTIDHPA